MMERGAIVIDLLENAARSTYEKGRMKKGVITDDTLSISRLDRKAMISWPMKLPHKSLDM